MKSKNTKEPVNRAAVVEDLNRLMAEEIEAGLRYFQIRYRLKDEERKGSTEFFDLALKETFEHAEAIAERIRSLGHTPQLKVNLLAGGGPVGFEEALGEILEIEQQALDAYKDLLPAVEGDAALEDFIRKQITIETEHVQEITTLLR